MSVFIYTTLFIFILFCNVFFNLKHKKCRHYSFRNSKWRQKGSFLTLVHVVIMSECEMIYGFMDGHASLANDDGKAARN